MNKITKEQVELYIATEREMTSRCEYLFNLIDRKYYDSRYSVWNTSVGDEGIDITLGGFFLHEYDEEYVHYPIEYMWLSDEEIMEKETKKIEEEKKKKEEEEEANKKEQEKRERTLLKQLKEKYENE